MAIVTSNFETGLFSDNRDWGTYSSPSSASHSSPNIFILGPGDEEEALSALSNPTLTNVIMSGFIRDNGLSSPHNRGSFYACRDASGQTEGVALIGHTVLFEAFTSRATESFATIARLEPSTHLLMGEHESVREFWNYYNLEAQSPRILNPVIFLQQFEPYLDCREVGSLQPATIKDLEVVMSAQAAMALEMSGVDPLKSDPVGFRERCLRRLKMRRIWVLMNKGRLIFKADVMAEPPEAAYIEGVYVSPEERGKGYGRSCLAGVCRRLLKQTKAIYLFVEHQDSRTRSFYESVGFHFAGNYDLLYF
jgi:uncharacterized protein